MVEFVVLYGDMKKDEKETLQHTIGEFILMMLGLGFAAFVLMFSATAAMLLVSKLFI